MYGNEHKEMSAMIKNESNLTKFNNSKVLPYDLLRAELFFPAREENQATNIVCSSMAVELAQTILVEVRDSKKTTSDYLSSEQEKFSCWETNHEIHEVYVGLITINDMAESPFSGLTQQFQSFGRILGIHASGISQARINGDFKRIPNSSNNYDSIYHCLSPKNERIIIKNGYS